MVGEGKSIPVDVDFLESMMRRKLAKLCGDTEKGCPPARMSRRVMTALQSTRTSPNELPVSPSERKTWLSKPS